MTKPEYLERLALSLKEVRILIAGTRAGIIRVTLETTESHIVTCYDRIADMTDEYFKEWIAA